MVQAWQHIASKLLGSYCLLDCTWLMNFRDVLQVVLGLQMQGLASTVLLRSAQPMRLITTESSEAVDTNRPLQSPLPLASHRHCKNW